VAELQSLAVKQNIKLIVDVEFDELTGHVLAIVG